MEAETRISKSPGSARSEWGSTRSICSVYSKISGLYNKKGTKALSFLLGTDERWYTVIRTRSGLKFENTYFIKMYKPLPKGLFEGIQDGLQNNYIVSYGGFGRELTIRSNC